MKIPNKRELEQVAFNHLSDLGFKDFMNPYKKFSSKPYSVLMIHATLASDISLHLRKNVLKTI